MYPADTRIIYKCFMKPITFRMGVHLSWKLGKTSSGVRDTYFDFRRILDPCKVRTNQNKRVRDNF